MRGTATGMLAAPRWSALVGEGLAQGAVTSRVQSHWPKASSSFNDSLGMFAKEVERRADGAFKMILLGDGEFAKGTDKYRAAQCGADGDDQPLLYAEAASLLYGIPVALREN